MEVYFAKRTNTTIALMIQHKISPPQDWLKYLTCCNKLDPLTCSLINDLWMRLWAVKINLQKVMFQFTIFCDNPTRLFFSIWTLHSLMSQVPMNRKQLQIPCLKSPVLSCQKYLTINMIMIKIDKIWISFQLARSYNLRLLSSKTK